MDNLKGKDICMIVLVVFLLIVSIHYLMDDTYEGQDEVPPMDEFVEEEVVEEPVEEVVEEPVEEVVEEPQMSEEEMMQQQMEQQQMEQQ